MNTSTSKNKTKRAVLLLLLALLSASVARAQDTILTIGEGLWDGVVAESTNVPFCRPAKYSMTQQIFLAEEIGTSGTISSIAFYRPERDPEHPNGGSTLGAQIYLKHTDKNAFDNPYDFVPVSASDMVFERDVFYEEFGWITFTFDTPFEYDGTSNLLVCCNDPSSDRMESGFTIDKVLGMSLAFDTNQGPIDLNAPPTPDNPNSWYSYRERNNIQLHILSNLPQPLNLAVSELTDMSATLTWEAPETSYTITGYAYQYKKNSDADWSSEVITTGTSATLNGLSGGTPYHFRVKTLYGDYSVFFNSSFYSDIDFVTTAISIPNLAVTDITDQSATLTWDEPQTPYTITGYVYQYTKINEWAWSPETTVNTTSVTLDGLSGGTEYQFRVKVLFNDHEGVYTYINFTTNAILLPNMAVSDITDQSATLTWEAPETPYIITGYTYQYKASDDSDWSAEITTTSPFTTLVGLSGPMEYQFRAKVLFNDHEGVYTYFNFTTLMGLPYEYGFEDGVNGWSMRHGWSMVDCCIDWQSTLNNNLNNTGIRAEAKHYGELGFQFALDNPFWNKSQYLISPCLYSNVATIMSFYYTNISSGHPESFKVGYSTTTNEISAFTWGDEISVPYPEWTRYENTFPAGTKYFAIKYTSNEYKLYLDDFSFVTNSPYSLPTDLTASNLTEHGATLTWTAPETSETITGYAYQYKPVNEWNWSAETTVNATSVTLNGLSINTSYDFRVKALYAEGNASNYLSTKFMTEGEMESIPHYQGFENGMGGWRIANGHPSTGLSSNGEFIHTGNRAFIFYYNSDIPNQYLFSPQFDDNNKPVTASFYYKNYSEGDETSGNILSYLAWFQVGYSTTTKDLDAFIWSDTITSSHQWQQYAADFPLGTKYVAIKWIRRNPLFLDDFSIEVSCPVVTIDGEHSITENFTNNTAFPPRCWENPSVVVDGVNRQWMWDWFFYHNDSGSAYSSRYGTTYLKLPDLHLPSSASAAQLSFWSLYTGLSDYAKCSVVLLDGDNETELWTPYVGSLQNERWYEIHIDLSAYMGQTINLAFKHEGNGISTWSVDNVELFSIPWLGDGTEQNPYIINTEDNWNYFCDSLEDNDTWNRFSGKYVKLGADITVTRMAGSSYHDFMGTFDGQGHTLTVAYGTAESPFSEEYAAPFRYVEDGANIHNLHVDGHIYTSNKYAGGIVGCQYGTVSVNNCRSSVIVHSSKEGDGTHGGIVAVHHGTLTVNGCVFDGRLLTSNGTTLCGGLIGYHYGTLTLSDCLYAPATEVTLAPDETYITNGATFCRNYSGTFDNCYYTETLGTAQGKLTHSITSEDVTLSFAGEATGYDVSGITAYNTGIMYDSVLYAGNGEEVSLTFTLTDPEGFSVTTAIYTPEGGTATELASVNGVYSFTMPDADVVIDAVTEYLIHNATEWGNFCDALQDNDTYNRFIGRTVKLCADITVTRMAGSDYHDFMGTFDGQGHTLTIAYGSAENPISEEYAAPFRNLENGAVIHNLHVEGHIYTSNQFASGIAGCQWGTVSISNCRSSVIIHSSINGDGTHGGIVAVHHGTLTVSGCVFDGRLLTTNGTTLCGGLIGWRYGTCTLSDCLYAPATNVTLAPGETYINNGATFCRNYNGTLDNCYYTETLGTAQGKLAIANPAVSPAGEATATYNVSGLAFYSNGVQFGEVFYYDSEMVATQTIALSAGVNWFSIYVDITLNDLKAALVAAMPNNNAAITIKSKTQNVKYQNGRWAGSLTTFDVTQLYLIIVPEACEISFEGVPINPSAHTVTITPGANWIAFPYNESMTVMDFFGSFPVNNDVVKSKFQNTRYNNGRWGGQLNTLIPGQGYIYNSAATGDRTFTFPTSAK